MPARLLLHALPAAGCLERPMPAVATHERFTERAEKAWCLGRALAHTQFPGVAQVVDFEAADVISRDFRNVANFHDALTTPALVRTGPPSPHGIGITAIAWLE